MSQCAVIRKGPRLEDIEPTPEELKEYAELEEWHEKSEARLRYAVLGVPNLNEDEILADVRKYASGAVKPVYVTNEKLKRLEWCFFDSSAKKYYIHKGRGEVYEFNPKTGEERLVVEYNRNN